MYLKQAKFPFLLSLKVLRRKHLYLIFALQHVSFVIIDMLATTKCIRIFLGSENTLEVITTHINAVC